MWYLDGGTWYADFHGFCFPPGATWLGCFAPDADFGDCTFLGESFFGNTSTYYSAKRVDVRKVATGVPGEDADEAEEEQSGPAQFLGNAYFSRATFKGPADFDGTVFHGFGRFSSAKFPEL